MMDQQAQSGDVVLRMLAKNRMSEKLAEDIDGSVRGIVERAYEVVRRNREAIDKLVEVLMEKESLTGEEFRAVLSKFAEIPSENVGRKPMRELIQA